MRALATESPADEVRFYLDALEAQAAPAMVNLRAAHQEAECSGAARGPPSGPGKIRRAGEPLAQAPGGKY